MNMSSQYSDTELADLSSLRDGFRRRGFYRPASGRFIAEFFVLNAMTWGGVALALFADGDAWRVVGLVASVLGGLGFGTNAHTASHRAATGSSWVDAFITQYGFGFMLGVSVGFWRDKHVRKHHHAPNIVGLDGDIDIAEPFAITTARLPSAPGWRARFVRVQWITIPLAIFFNGFAVQKNGWKYSLAELRGGSRATGAPLFDLSIVVLHYIVWLLLPCILVGPAGGFLLYGLRIGLMGYALFAAFAPAHFPAPALAVTADCDDNDYALRQTATTINFETGPIGRFFCAGVEYQIEHHLFPTINHYYYPRVAAGVRAFCEKHGYPYRSLPWSKAILMSFTPFRTPKRVHADFRSTLPTNMTRRELVDALKHVQTSEVKVTRGHEPTSVGG